jgi:hypothetical protein
VVTLEPFNGAGNIQPPFIQTEEHTGDCFTGSLVDFRPDAWRCIADNTNQLFDPCFANFGIDSNRVGCLASPKDNGVVLINLNDALDPSLANPPPGVKGDWAVELEDNGTICLRFGGAHDLKVGGKLVEFLCQDGRGLAQLSRKNAVWSGLVGKLKGPDRSATTLRVTTGFG